MSYGQSTLAWLVVVVWYTGSAALALRSIHRTVHPSFPPCAHRIYRTQPTTHAAYSQQHFSASPCTSPSAAGCTQGGWQALVRPHEVRVLRDARAIKHRRTLPPSCIRLRAALLTPRASSLPQAEAAAAEAAAAEAAAASALQSTSRTVPTTPHRPPTVASQTTEASLVSSGGGWRHGCRLSVGRGRYGSGRALERGGRHLPRQRRAGGARHLQAWAVRPVERGSTALPDDGAAARRGRRRRPRRDHRGGVDLRRDAAPRAAALEDGQGGTGDTRFEAPFIQCRVPMRRECVASFLRARMCASVCVVFFPHRRA